MNTYHQTRKKGHGIFALILILCLGLLLGTLEVVKHVPAGVAKTQHQQPQ